MIEFHNYVFRNSPPTAQELIGNNAIDAGVVLPLAEVEILDPDELLEQPCDRVHLRGVTLTKLIRNDDKTLVGI